MISTHHNTHRVLPLKLIASRWSEPGTRWEVKLKPGKYLLAREIWWGREVHFAHSEFGYHVFEVKAGERIEPLLSEIQFER